MESRHRISLHESLFDAGKLVEFDEYPRFNSNI
jgi:hypothetical protein